MKTYSLITVLLLTSLLSAAQTVTQRLDKAVKLLQQDPQMKHAAMSVYVVETATGKPVYTLNEQLGLAPASTQKLFTSVAAFELLGKDFRYNTEIGYQGSIQKDSLDGFIYIESDGDPTFGSNRFNSTKSSVVFDSVKKALDRVGIKKINDLFRLKEGVFDQQSIPDGWIWQDIGNYYGAGVNQLNWKENQYDLIFKSGSKLNKPVEVLKKDSNDVLDYNFKSLVSSAAAGSGDQTYIYLPLKSNTHLVEGTIPINENNFIISGAITNSQDYFINDLRKYLRENKILNMNCDSLYHLEEMEIDAFYPIYRYHSPTLDSINYWFLQKSVNLYGEALVRTIGEKETMFNSIKSGVPALINFWSKNGIEKSALNIVDGSGLSPQNRVTTNALVTALQFAKDKNWYSSFYNALPMYNGMHMKSGTIGGAKAYAGYHTSKAGVQYTFAIIINNYDSEAGSIVPKMFKVLDELK